MNKFLILVAFIMVCCAIDSTAEEQHGMSSRCGIHGMVLFGGKGHYYLSHLPLFHRPHDMQLIAEVEFPEDKHQLIDALLETAALVTVVPELFDLNKMHQGGFAFQGDVYNGHFERGGRVALPALRIKVGQIIEQKYLMENFTQQVVTYRLIPQGSSQSSAFYFRVIDSRPAADHIIAVQSAQTLPKTLSFSGKALHADATAIAELLKVPLNQVHQVYLEIDELQ